MANMENWPAELGVRIADTNDQIGIAQFTPDRNFALQSIRLLLLKVGTAGGSETLQCVVCSQSNDLSVGYASSNTVNLSTISTDTNFIGFYRFDFNEELFSTQSTYYITLKLSNYTRNNITYFIAGVFDWPYSNHVNNAYGTDYWNQTACTYELYAKHYS